MTLIFVDFQVGPTHTSCGAGRNGVPRAPFIQRQKPIKPVLEVNKEGWLEKAGLGGRRKMLGSSGRGGKLRQKEWRGTLGG